MKGREEKFSDLKRRNDQRRRRERERKKQKQKQNIEEV